MEKEIEIVREILRHYNGKAKYCHDLDYTYDKERQALQKVLKVMQATKPSQRRIGETEYQCTHKDKNEINGDCVWCALSVAETGLKKQREIIAKRDLEIVELKKEIEERRIETNFEHEVSEQELTTLKARLEKLSSKEKIKDFFDDKVVRVFDPADGNYKHVKITGRQASEIAQAICDYVEKGI